MAGEVKKIGINYILGWIFGALFILAGATSFTKDVTGAILLILGGLIILPPFNKFIEQKYNVQLSGWLRFVLFLILVGTGMTMLPATTNNAQINTAVTQTTIGNSSQTSQQQATGTMQPQSQKKIVISHSAKKMDIIGQFSEPKADKTFLVVTMDIENQGYDKFSVNPYYFKLIANNVEYDIAMDTFSLDDKLNSVDVLNGGSTKGSIAFEVPSNIQNYQLKYRGFGYYEILYKSV